MHSKTSIQMRAASRALLLLTLFLVLTTRAQELPAVPGVWEGHVKGVGGVFFKVKDPDAVREWYQEHFGIPAAGPGFAHFFWRDYLNANETHRTVWAPFPMTEDAAAAARAVDDEPAIRQKAAACAAFSRSQISRCRAVGSPNT